LQGLPQVKWKCCWSHELLLDRGESKIVFEDIPVYFKCLGTIYVIVL
jgi:hypothetical protein